MTEKVLILVLLLTGTVGIQGCAPQVSYSPYSHRTFAPTTRVDVLRTKLADRRYLELGELCIRVNRSTQKTAVLQLTEKAKKIGADGIILIGDRPAGFVGIPIGQLAVAVPLRDACAVAIRYTEP